MRTFPAGGLRLQQCLLIEWPIGDSEPTNYFLSTLPPRTPGHTDPCLADTGEITAALTRLAEWAEGDGQ